jgi:hypothetical protein
MESYFVYRLLLPKVNVSRKDILWFTVWFMIDSMALD